MTNRETRRKQDKKDSVKKYSLNDVQRALSIAIEMKRYSKGHLFSKALKDRCVFCGLTMKTKKTCDYWAITIFDRLQSALVNPLFYKDDELQSLWLQHGDEYQNIRLPLAAGAKPDAKA